MLDGFIMTLFMRLLYDVRMLQSFTPETSGGSPTPVAVRTRLIR